MRQASGFASHLCAFRIAGTLRALGLLTIPLGMGFLAPPLEAQERILSYDSTIEIASDGSMEVLERITVQAEGRQIRRGIYRDFPTRYRDRYGNRVRVDFEVLGVLRNGNPEPWFTERVSNGVRVNTGNDDFLVVPAEYTFTIRYRTTRQLGFFEEHDELYWNAIGAGWIFPIESGTVEVRLPEAVPVEAMGVEAYTGPQGAQGNAYEAEVLAPGIAQYRLTQGLGSYEGFTIVLTFPKGVIPAPTLATRAGWLLLDNRGVLVALAGLAFLFYFCFTRWSQMGRDPDPGIVIARYEPAEGLTPAGIRFVRKMGYDPRCFSSDVLALAVDRRLSITQEKGFLKEEWALHRGEWGSGLGVSGTAGRKPPAEMDASQRALLAGLFPGGRPMITLKNTNASTLSAAREAHKAALDVRFVPSAFKRNRKQVALSVGILGVTAIAAFATSGGFGIPVIFFLLTLMAAGTVVFAFLIRAPTPEGRALLDQIEGLKLYLSVAERDELARLPGPDGAPPPPVDAGRFESLLPYAVALEVEDAWTEKFTAAVGAAAATAAMQTIPWYHGSGNITNMSNFSKALGSSLSSQISSASTPPGSSSGGGGGGSSGGGGGGGGGGGR